ncbi:TPA: septum formation initiator family protein, partial [Clostridioides difficile]|nr:septum formation initiator family protein [Clostridioides difficile]
YKKEIASLNKQLKKTEIQINALKKDEKSYEGDLEDIARKRLNMVKPNETVYVDINR